MIRKYIPLLFVVGFAILMVLVTKQRERISIPTNSTKKPTSTAIEAATIISTPLESATISAPLTVTPLAVYPILDQSIVSGKIIYWDIHQSHLVIMDASGDNKFSLSYDPQEGLIPNFSTPIQWSPNGQMVAFGCLDALNPEFSGVCILDLVEYLSNNSSGTLAENIKMIRLPPGYIAGRYEAQINSLEWTKDGRQIVLAPFCLLDISQDFSDCLNEFGDISPKDKIILDNAQYIAPSPADPNRWMVAEGGSLYLFTLDPIKTERLILERSGKITNISWTRDGKKVAVLGGAPGDQHGSSLTIVDINGSEYKTLLSIAELRNRIDPELVIRPGTLVVAGYYTHINGYPPRQNLSWSPDNRYIALNIFYFFPKMDPVMLDSAGIFYFDTQNEELLPVEVDFETLQLFASPDWYACNETENVCELYE